MAISNGYATLPDIKEWLGIGDTNDDAMLERAVEAASRQIDSFCGRRFWVDTDATGVRYYRPVSPTELKIDDLAAAAGLTVETDDNDDGVFETAWVASNYQLEPVNAATAIPEALPYTRIVALSGWFPTFSTRGYRYRVRLTGKWGWPAVPTDVKQACLIAATRLFKRKDSPEGVQGFGEFGVVRVSGRLDPDVGRLLAPYRLPGIA